MRRFYQKVEAGTAPGGYVIRLDGKMLKTPLQNNLIFESQPLAEAIAAEWAAQIREIAPSSMPLTQLANTMVDKFAGPERVDMNQLLCEYGASDLVCYFAAKPRELVARQEEHWLPLLEWMRIHFGVPMERVSGIQYHQQPAAALEKIKKMVEVFNPVQFTVVQAATGITGSLVISLALLEGKINAVGAWQAACVDEIFQLEKWGEDAEARKRLDRLRADLEVLERFLGFF
jgi:chaperone required for assembly of F1-ATPase